MILPRKTLEAWRYVDEVATMQAVVRVLHNDSLLTAREKFRVCMLVIKDYSKTTFQQN